MMKNIILLAPPAAGKGTQAQLIADKYNIPHLSTGDIFRQEVASESELGKRIKAIMEQAKLVNDEIVLEVIKKELVKDKYDRGYILDGFPRTLHQAKEYDKMSLTLNRKIDGVIFLDISKEEAMKRVLGRMTCPQCGATYNISFNKDNICLKCNQKLTKRDDDNEKDFMRRFNDYIKKTKPLIEYYEKKGLLYRIDSSRDIQEVFEDIEKLLDNKDWCHDYN
jgi:adenylate kinase